ncbi:hypothetical protein PACTADRAFT_32098 [Pachysolen tannophilus NRRL Y-2460]|uniref:BED-type domain-containing protein n=1 Tax=Pachysolen tannophilus NRRL Y-2460 TaxID=669874 RepID=A0A1E4TXW2_PACTA|nr:hypothetical protein PACTADRAFT_32098 [Pachysolen tannophilus NRRL Y-2460]
MNNYDISKNSDTIENTLSQALNHYHHQGVQLAGSRGPMQIPQQHSAHNVNSQNQQHTQSNQQRVIPPTAISSPQNPQGGTTGTGTGTVTTPAAAAAAAAAVATAAAAGSGAGSGSGTGTGGSGSSSGSGPGSGSSSGSGAVRTTSAPAGSVQSSSTNPATSLPLNASSTTAVNTHHHRVNKPGQKFGAKKKSWVWNWFVQDHTDPNVAICDQCGKVIRRLPSDKGSPKKLSEHLRTHKIDKETVNPRRDQMIGGGPTNTGTSNSLKTVNPGGLGHLPQHLLNEFDVSPYSQIKFHKDIMKFLTDNKLPISVVKSSSFRQMVFTLRPESVEDLNELNNIYASLMEVLKNNENKDDANNSWL